jgi:hypothetical protein
MALVWFVMACAFSVVVAHVFHLCVEGPSMRLAAWFKRSVPESSARVSDPAETADRRSPASRQGADAPRSPGFAPLA